LSKTKRAKLTLLEINFINFYEVPAEGRRVEGGLESKKLKIGGKI